MHSSPLGAFHQTLHSSSPPLVFSDTGNTGTVSLFGSYFIPCHGVPVVAPGHFISQDRVFRPPAASKGFTELKNPYAAKRTSHGPLCSQRHLTALRDLFRASDARLRRSLQRPTTRLPSQPCVLTSPPHISTSHHPFEAVTTPHRVF
jgi:hypothetical protein